MGGQLLVAGSQRRVEREAALLEKLQLPGFLDRSRLVRPLAQAAARRHAPSRQTDRGSWKRIIEGGAAIYEQARVHQKLEGVGQMIVCTNRARGRILPLHLQVVSTAPLDEVWGRKAWSKRAAYSAISGSPAIAGWFSAERAALWTGRPSARCCVSSERSSSAFTPASSSASTGPSATRSSQLPAIRREGNISMRSAGRGHASALVLLGEWLAGLASGSRATSGASFPGSSEPLRWIGYHAALAAMEVAGCF